MQWNWASSIDELWRSPALPMWATLAAAAFSAIVVLVVLIRADKTMANGALAVITLLSIGIASTFAVRGFSTSIRPVETAETRPVVQQVAFVPALACLDGLAGESVEAACEKAVFGAADTAAAAVSYTAAQVSRLAGAVGGRSLSAEQQTLRSTLERDRFGLVAQVLTVRDKCTVSECSLFRIVSDPSTIRNNMTDRLYDSLILRHATSWNAAQADSAQPPVAGLFGNTPTGKPSTVDFPTAASTPPVNIMTAEPPSPPPPPPAATPPRAPAAANAQAAPPKNAAAPKRQTQSPPKNGPTQLTPRQAAPEQQQSPSRSIYIPPR